MGNRGYQLWDEEDGFFYDVLRHADGSYHKLRVRSLVGLIPLFAIERLEENWIEPFPEFKSNLDWFLKNRRDLVRQCVTTIERDGQKVHVLAVMDPEQIRALIRRICDPQEFRSAYGLRSLSKYHEAHPFRLGENEVRYEPAEAAIKIKGGNSNWRGPIWFPTAFLLIESLRKLQKAYGQEFTVETCGASEDIGTITQGLADSMINLFLPDEQHRRPIYRGMNKFSDDPYWRDLILFNEYFHGDTGQGLGASHQTGWTALVASLIDEWR
jgi:Glycosyl hydrolase family 63 C-terminal domain